MRLTVNKDHFADVQEGIFEACKVLRNQGQAEYAGGENAFGNFERLATKLQIDRKKVLLTYAEKHLDGIYAYVNGHKSQREPIQGRIKDLIVYLTLLYGMMEEEESIGTKISDPSKLPVDNDLLKDRPLPWSGIESAQEDFRTKQAKALEKDPRFGNIGSTTKG